MPEDAIILNFLPILAGGGLQNAMSFASHLPSDERLVGYVRKGSSLTGELRRAGLRLVEVRNSYIARLLAEIAIRSRYPRGTVCFTLFGPKPIFSGGWLYNICGFAYSNLLYPEVDFWFWCTRMEKQKKYIIDLYRKFSASSSDELVFETKLLEMRARKASFLRHPKLHTVLMAPGSRISSSDHLNPIIAERLDKSYIGAKRILYLCSAHPNKRIHLLPNILAEDSCRLLSFVVTIPDEHPYAQAVFDRAKRLGVDHRLINVGPVPAKQVGKLLECVDAVINIAALESFSNNWVEAWTTGKPLIVTESDWSRHSCGNAAVYVDPGAPKASCDAIVELLADRRRVQSLVDCGTQLLKKYPTSKEKTQQLLDLINANIATGPLYAR